MSIAIETRARQSWPNLILAAVTVGMLALWLDIKVRLFEGLSYASDLFVSLQLSWSGWEGRPWGHDNFYGNGWALHNYFLIVAFYPLTARLGAYGLFIGLALIWGASILYGATGWSGLALRIALLLGPVAFRIWDNPIYAWHSELLYLPLGIFFAEARLRNSRLAWLFGTLLCLVKEDGAVLACALDQSVLLLSAARGEGAPWRKLALHTSAWIGVFVLGFLVLWTNRSGASPGRIGEIAPAIARIAAEPNLVAALRWQILSVALLLLPLAAIVAGFVGLRRAALIWLCSAPLWAIAITSSLPYSVNEAAFYFHGLVWPPRLVLLWTFGSAVVMGAVSAGSAAGSQRWRLVQVVGAAVALLIFQHEFLARRLGYSALGRAGDALGDAVPRSRLSERETSFLRCVADGLPWRTPVMTSQSLYAVFHEDLLVGPDGEAKALNPPRVIACDTIPRLPFGYDCAPAVERRGWVPIRVDHLLLAAEPPLTPLLQICATSSFLPAGTTGAA
jgi:hypothetical protein